MWVPVYDTEGQVVGEIELRDDVFGVPFNQAVVHQALVRQLANSRQGTVDTRTRGEVVGSTRKLFRQKGTGRARQGAIRAPHHRGGGVVFGPQPRSFAQAMPKKMRRLAIRVVLSNKAAEGQLAVVKGLELEQPKTKDMLRILTALKSERTALVVTPQKSRNVYLSARNLPGVTTLPADQLNVGDLLKHTNLVITEDAVRRVEEALRPEAAPASLEEESK